MTTLASAILPLPPGINASYKTGNGKFYGSPELRSFKDDAYYALLGSGMLDWPAIHMVQKAKKKIPLAVSIDFYFPTLWKRDIDGGEKAVIDAVFNHMCLNDNLIVDKHTRKLVDRANPRCEIGIFIWQPTAEMVFSAKEY